jgi:hypothetical protein
MNRDVRVKLTYSIRSNMEERCLVGHATPWLPSSTCRTPTAYFVVDKNGGLTKMGTDPADVAFAKQVFESSSNAPIMTEHDHFQRLPRVVPKPSSPGGGPGEVLSIRGNVFGS